MTISQIQTAPQAIEFFRAAGFQAFEREWAIGRSIGVGADPFDDQGIKGWRRMVYLAPSNGGWALHNLCTTAVEPTEFGSLDEACHGAVEALLAWASVGDHSSSRTSPAVARER